MGHWVSSRSTPSAISPTATSIRLPPHERAASVPSDRLAVGVVYAGQEATTSRAGRITARRVPAIGAAAATTAAFIPYETIQPPRRASARTRPRSRPSAWRNGASASTACATGPRHARSVSRASAKSPWRRRGRLRSRRGLSALRSTRGVSRGKPAPRLAAQELHHRMTISELRTAPFARFSRALELFRISSSADFEYLPGRFSSSAASPRCSWCSSASSRIRCACSCGSAPGGRSRASGRFRPRSRSRSSRATISTGTLWRACSRRISACAKT